MIKHIITTKCNRKYTYCITRNVEVKQNLDFNSVMNIYYKMGQEDSSLMLTGGEPTLADNFLSCIYLANWYFDNVYLTTQNPEILSNDFKGLFLNAINFSIHDLKNIPTVNIKVPVYASILDHLYNPKLIEELKALGYSGLTINEEQRKGKKFVAKLPRSTKKFSIRINRKGKCLKDKMILPDLTVINSFEKYL